MRSWVNLKTLSFCFGVFISFFVVYYAISGFSASIINTIGISALLIIYSFYPFLLITILSAKPKEDGNLEKILQWPYWGKKDKVPTNMGPWWVNRTENLIMLLTFAPLLVILLLMWLAKAMFGS